MSSRVAAQRPGSRAEDWGRRGMDELRQARMVDEDHELALELPRAGSLPPPVRRIMLDRAPSVIDPSSVQQSAARQLEAPGVERMRLESLSVLYTGKPAVKTVDLSIRQGEVLALIGPSGCGKTTLLRTLNRLTELTATATREGRILLDGQDVDGMEATTLRRRVSMVFQQPNP